MKVTTNERQRRKDDRHAQMLARQQLAQEHRTDLCPSDLGQIAQLTQNRHLASLVKMAYGRRLNDDNYSY